jgi:hypothetical protein
MVLEPVLCPTCQSINVGRHGHSAEGKARGSALKVMMTETPYQYGFYRDTFV